MNKKTLKALGAFAVLGLVAFFVLRQPEKGQRVGEKARPVPRLKLGSDFDTLEITKGKDTTTLKKDGDKYKVAAPIQYPADDYSGKGAFEAIEKLEFGSIVSDQKAKHGEFELGTDALRVVVKKADKVLADLIVGKSVSSYTMLRLKDKDEVWQAVGSLKFTFDKDTAAWRDKSIVTVKSEDVETLAIASKGAGKIALKKEPKPDAGASEDTWSIVESPIKIAEMDKSIAPGAVTALAGFKTNDFADAAKPEETGLADPQATVTLGLKGGKSVSVLIGNKKGEDDFYVKAADAPQVFLVKKYSVERLMKRPIEFRDKTLCNLAESGITEVAVTHGADSYTIAKGGSDWKATRPAGLDLDTTKVSGITGAFKEWKATSFADDPSPKATGLGKPKATIAAKSADKKTCQLKIGDETKDKQSYYAQPVGSVDVYVVAKWSADRVLKKVDDIKKAGTTVAKK